MAAGDEQRPWPLGTRGIFGVAGCGWDAGSGRARRVRALAVHPGVSISGGSRGKLADSTDRNVTLAATLLAL